MGDPVVSGKDPPRERRQQPPKVTREQGIIFTAIPEVSTLDYAKAINNHLGQGKTIFINRIHNSRMIAYVESAESAEQIACDGFDINGVFTEVSRLTKQSEKIIISACPPEIRHKDLRPFIERWAKITSDIFFIEIGSGEAGLDNLFSFKRTVYVMPFKEMPRSVTIKHENRNAMIYFEKANQYCETCSKRGHNSERCHKNRSKHENGKNSNNLNEPHNGSLSWADVTGDQTGNQSPFVAQKTIQRTPPTTHPFYMPNQLAFPQLSQNSQPEKSVAQSKTNQLNKIISIAGNADFLKSTLGQQQPAPQKNQPAIAQSDPTLTTGPGGNRVLKNTRSNSGSLSNNPTSTIPSTILAEPEKPAAGEKMKVKAVTIKNKAPIDSQESESDVSVISGDTDKSESESSLANSQIKKPGPISHKKLTKFLERVRKKKMPKVEARKYTTNLEGLIKQIEDFVKTETNMIETQRLNLLIANLRKPDK